MSDKKTAIITGASQGIGAGLVEGFLKEGYNVVATSLDVSHKLRASPSLVLVDGDIGKQETATKAVDAAIQHFGSIDVLVANAGIFLTTADFHALVSTNLLGFLYITQLSVKQMLKQKSGSVVSISAALADRPIAGENSSVSMITKGGLNAAIQNLAVEYRKEGIRFNAVAPGPVDTSTPPEKSQTAAYGTPPMHKDAPKDSTQPVINMATVKDVVDAVLYLSQAGHVSGEILHVDNAAPARRW